MKLPVLQKSSSLFQNCFIFFHIIAIKLATVCEGPGAAGLPAPLVRVLEEVGLYFDVVKKETNVKD